MKKHKILITGGSGFIGTNLIDLLEDKDVSLINIDKNKPNKVEHFIYWNECDIMDIEKFKKIANVFQPDMVIHLAARTDTDSNCIEDYDENITGTRNLLKIVGEIKSIQRLIITSTQFVNQYNGAPKNDEDYAPHTTYGESKVINEKDTRSAGLDCTWVIIRPTNIWGPWHKRYPFEFWKILSEGKYFHPGKEKVIRSYGYVGNVVWQIFNMINCPPEIINKKVFYVGDRPIDIYDWVNGFSLMQTGKSVRVVPGIFVKTLAIIGQILLFLKIKFPITLSRYKSMTTSNDVPMDLVFDSFGTPPYSLQGGINETVDWMKVYYPNLIKK